MKLNYEEDEHIPDFHDSDLDDIGDDPYHNYASADKPRKDTSTGR